MKGVFLDAGGPTLRTDLPRPERPGEALVRVTTAGVCATDLELVKGYMGHRGVIGHEWVGIVEAAPEAAWIGKRVVGDINCPCGACETCRARRSTHCPHRTVLGILGRDGASYRVVGTTRWGTNVASILASWGIAGPQSRRAFSAVVQKNP